MCRKCDEDDEHERRKSIKPPQKFDGDDVRARMIQFIKTRYASVLTKEDLELIDTPGGLEKLHRKYCL